MPRFDGEGPSGMGPMTGKGRGYCIVPLDGDVKNVDVNLITPPLRSLRRHGLLALGRRAQRGRRFGQRPNRW